MILDTYFIETRAIIRSSETLRLKPYAVSGQLIIGYGRDLNKAGISQAEAERMREDDIYSKTPRVSGHKGLQLKPYRGGRGILTIGYGRDLYGTGINLCEAEMLLDNDIRAARQKLTGRVWFDRQKPYRKIALVCLCFDMGLPRLLQCTGMIKALLNHDYHRAARAILHSSHIWQNLNHADRLAGMIDREEYSPFNKDKKP